jgi:hypothetical protein
MKNVEVVSRAPSFRVRVQGAPPPRGWFVKYLSGMEEASGVKPDYWLTEWHVSSDGYAIFNFEPDPLIVFPTEAEASPDFSPAVNTIV